MAIKCEIYRDSMQNYKKYAIPPAQLIIADVPYNVGNNFYGSNPMWYKGAQEHAYGVDIRSDHRACPPTITESRKQPNTVFVPPTGTTNIIGPTICPP